MIRLLLPRATRNLATTFPPKLLFLSWLEDFECQDVSVGSWLGPARRSKVNPPAGLSQRCHAACVAVEAGARASKPAFGCSDMACHLTKNCAHCAQWLWVKRCNNICSCILLGLLQEFQVQGPAWGAASRHNIKSMHPYTTKHGFFLYDNVPIINTQWQLKSHFWDWPIK